MAVVPFRGLARPMGRYKEILEYVLRPSPEVKMVDLCCGLGFAKTIIALQAAALTLEIDGNQVGLFLEPDVPRVKKIFLKQGWLKHIPPEFYHWNKGDECMEWHNGSILYYACRNISGSKQQMQDKFRGVEFTFVVDDETAIGFDYEQYQNTIGRIRAPSPVRYYFTLSTPKVGPYGRFLKRGGNKIFRGRTRDNHYLLLRDPDYEKRQRAGMSEQQARRELDGELVALEGRIWKNSKYSPYDPNDPKKDAWPNGNRNDIWTGFRKNEPWWLFCDTGSATGSYVVVQAMDPIYRGHEMYNGELVWVAIADLCPSLDANASTAFQRLKMEFGVPLAVAGGSDINTNVSTDGRTISKFVENIFGPGVNIFPCNERIYNPQLKLDSLSALLCTTTGERRFTIARDFVSLDTESHRGVREMLDEDQYLPIDKRRINEILPKNRENIVQHTRDALTIGSCMVMNPPHWAEDRNPAA